MDLIFPNFKLKIYDAELILEPKLSKWPGELLRRKPHYKKK